MRCCFGVSGVLGFGSPTNTSAVASSPAFLPGDTLPDNRSSRVLPSVKSTSGRPAAQCSRSSSGSVSGTGALAPDSAILNFPLPLASSVASAFLDVTSVSAVQTSVLTYSFLTSSCSLFSRESPCPHTAFVFSTVSMQPSILECSDSSLDFGEPSSMVLVILTVLGVPPSLVFNVDRHMHVVVWFFVRGIGWGCSSSPRWVFYGGSFFVRYFLGLSGVWLCSGGCFSFAPPFSGLFWEPIVR